MERTVFRDNGSYIRRQFTLALHIILLSLVRKGKLLNARWEHVDFEALEWVVPAEHSTMGKPQGIYLARQIADLFREWKASGHL